ncbi:hypothetical protein N7463_007862 [Penicillium fimorum]|uniref:5'-deoxynucleotidase n=1 Tax=Penicillium fimorum TaxID=1882269 RepID=A0A9W9XX71_9EURO|nr:hypothetical protein N7463_007862 [Penicillium fimorum]
MGSLGPDPLEWDPRSVAATLPCTLTEGTTSPVPFFHLLAFLKTTKREGWQQAGIKHGESIAEHMYRMSTMTMFCPAQLASRLCIARCIEMSLVHDMAECLVGDITPLHTHITKQEKARREAATMEYISQSLLGGISGSEKACERLMGLFQEYEENRTLEARFVHDVDKLEMVLQTIEYERSLGRDLSEFYHVLDDICLPEVREWAAVVMKDRKLAPACPRERETV